MQDPEEQHPFPVRPGDDPHPGVVQNDFPVATGHDWARGEGPQHAVFDPGHSQQC